MKKLVSLMLAVLLVASMTTVAFAASTTTLTTTVPAATYTLNIPADQQIPFGAESTKIGSLRVTDASGFAEGKDLKVTLSYTAFASDAVSTTIPFTVSSYYSTSDNNHVRPIPNNGFVTFVGLSSGGVREHFVSGTTEKVTSVENALNVDVKSTDWGKALAGEYTATITFTAEVVAG